MSREEFIRYLAANAGSLDIRLHRAGELAGLPCEFHQALAIAKLLEALGRPAPSSGVLRGWYGHAAWANAEAARWVYRVVEALRDPDLEQLDLGELMSFSVRLDAWSCAAKWAARDVREKLRAV